MLSSWHRKLPPSKEILGMNRSQLRKLIGADSEMVLEVLSRRQHMHPHAPLEQVLRETIDELHCCPQAVSRAVEWLELDWQRPIGRLRRTELTQLARTIYRLWRQSVTQSAAQPQSQA
jgi:hypothetical protein